MSQGIFINSYKMGSFEPYIPLSSLYPRTFRLASRSPATSTYIPMSAPDFTPPAGQEKAWKDVCFLSQMFLNLGGGVETDYKIQSMDKTASAWVCRRSCLYLSALRTDITPSSRSSMRTWSLLPPSLKDSPPCSPATRTSSNSGPPPSLRIPSSRMSSSRTPFVNFSKEPNAFALPVA